MGFEQTTYELKTAHTAVEVAKELMNKVDIVVLPRDGQSTLVYFSNEFSNHGADEVMKAAFGEGEYKVETMPLCPISPYGAAKLAGELYCQSFTAVYGLETVCLRYFNVFGPRQDPTSQYAAVIPLFITSMLEGKSPTIHGDGLQSRDFTFIDNVVHGNLLARRASDAAGQVMNLATGGQINLLELVARINGLLGTSIVPIHSGPRQGDILHSRASIERARDLLDYAPVVDFNTGLSRTLEWYRG